jgi:hypothetical protein
MFFVGATGQLLTLILTVCLPFVFFLSGNQSINITDSSLQIEVCQVQHEIAFNELNTVSSSETSATEFQHYNFIAENHLYKKIPLREFNIKQDWFYIESSGNKAPPVFHCFC